MRIVLDTNVLISAALKQRSTPALAVETAHRLGTLLKSSATERQLLEVLSRPYLASLIAPEAQAWLRQLLERAETVAIVERISACRDPTDDKFLELAVNGHADVIVSGDGDLLALHPFRDIPIVQPATFLRQAAP